jgi:hypothetical protein
MAGAEAATESRYALIVSGVAGGPDYAESHQRWRKALASALVGTLEFPKDQVVTLSETEQDGLRADREGVRTALGRLRSRVGDEDLLLVVLIGHGTYDGIDAKFNLVGPDLEASEWHDLLEGIRGRLVVINTTSSSFPFLERLAAPGRIVITATDSAAQRYETVFPQFFAEALEDPGTDLDKDGRISLWEVFSVASNRVRRWYEQQGRLSTERALLDDTGGGLGQAADMPGPVGLLARRTFLDAGTGVPVSDDRVLAGLRLRQSELLLEVEDLKARKALMPEAEYRAELERVLLELARVSRDVRMRSRS